MFLKIGTLGCFSFGILGIVIAILCLLEVGKMRGKTLVLENKISKFQDKEKKLNNMQKTVEVIYNLSSYEAHYYTMIFYDFSEKYKLPWEVYPALIKIESGFNSGVMSKERAKGMTQVLESTGKYQAEKLGISFNEGTLWNCVLNMVIGFDFFSEGYAEYIDSSTQEKAQKHAMKRYCGGPGYSFINDSAKVYVGTYKNSLWEEYTKVSYVYKGVCYDQFLMDLKGHKNSPLLAEFSNPIKDLKALFKM